MRFSLQSTISKMEQGGKNPNGLSPKKKSKLKYFSEVEMRPVLT
jgi:hypothetical protein